MTLPPLQPEIEQVLALGRALGGPSLTEQAVDHTRRVHEAGTRELSGDGPVLHNERGIEIPGGPPIRARLYEPTEDPVGTVVYFHGGGWVVGSLASVEPLCRAIAAASGARVLSVDYRLAPEDRYPAAVTDALAATRWAIAELPGPIAVAGDSAGGNLATIVARHLAADIVFQGLYYPVCDGARNTPSYREIGPEFGLTGADMAWFFDHYLDGQDALAPDVSPLRADLAGSPPAWILVASHDPLRDEGLAYAQALAAAGVAVELRRYDGCCHGFARWLAVASPARDAVAELGVALQRALSGD